MAVVILCCQSQAMENSHVNPVVHKSSLGKLVNVLFKKDHNICCVCPNGICYVKCCTTG
jgi:hypothetical protein